MKVLMFLANFIANKKVLEFIFVWLRKMAKTTDTKLDDKIIDTAEFLLTDPDAHKVIDEIIQIIQREKSK